MSSYLIEFRFQSKRVKKYLKDTILEINRKYKVGKRRNVPHITLVGPIKTQNEKRLISDFAQSCSTAKLMKFKLKGFSTFDSNKVIYVNILPSDLMNKFRVELSKKLQSYCKLPSHDKRTDKDRFGYHSTLAMKLSDAKFKAIKKYLRRNKKPNYSQIVMRVTLLKGGKILREYDFMQRRLLTRKQALNKNTLKRSKFLLREFMKGRFNPNKKLKKKKKIKSETFWSKLAKFFGIK